VSAHECQGNLVDRERRGPLSANDATALRAHLTVCASCRLQRQVHADFEEIGAIDPNDGVRIERLSAVARGFRAHRRPRAPSPFGVGTGVGGVRSFAASSRGSAFKRARTGAVRFRTLAMAAAMLLMASTVSAAVWWWRHPARLETAAATPARAVTRAAGPARDRIARVRSARLLASAEPSEPAPPPEEAPPPPVVSVPAHSVRAARRAPSTPPSSAGLLLRHAGDARRGGEPERAIWLYQRLQREFPSSSEAVMSAVPLGGMLLARNLPRAALAQFDRYLASSRGGVLIPEALYGRARALGALGDRPEEQRTWTRLLGDFPASAYSPLGRRRLAELR
jgi:hypothetical protein